ncbi:choline ABC transporter substrate-binding protein [Paenirhodobacter populi]|uniref:Choline ABC transporter substrate-binding protein n=1 Tax=Paenirhodobacter populi TaxID=2306993 RepID=A0A443JV45_9RHOB|nr:choline ABC transporter substrate-binding protein [Sinirhodobacter populi]RWR09841.1 choline ABC transporter substrate-binding protein [Sinirhodobacter populi]RWR10499.1 choline ABC transporter substrate-binding protein [Sinirhodobacter populi]RWR24390.1 choline ABC transporter substrate-binding protein [Sinirhodobacter populi]
MMLRAFLLAGTAALAIGQSAQAAGCDKVTFADVGWTDISATTGVATTILQALGYETDVKLLSLPVTYTAMKAGDVDVFLGNWMPSQTADVGPYLEDGSVETIRTNLTGAKYTLATNAKGAEIGIKDFADIAPHKDELGGKIYGIEPGNDGNRLLIEMTEEDKFGLKGFEIVESSEQGMLAQVARADREGSPVVFLGWAPHPMNSNFELTYLSGGDDIFGPDFGGAQVDTNVRKGYVAECPNIGKFLTNLEFTLPLENEIMGRILDDGEEPAAAAKAWLAAHPEVVTPWLAGVTTKDGGDAEAAVQKALN